MDISELEKSAQYEVIGKLQEKVRKLEEENKSLQLMLESSVPLVQNNIQDLSLGISNERLVCETQITRLKNKAVMSELTLEESRKFQIYVDILEKLKKENDDGVKADISEEQLLQLVKNE